MRGFKRNRGFSLLEAVVAMTILAVSGGAIFAWINTLMIGISRQEALSQVNSAVAQSLVMVQTINPMQQPAGDRAMGRYSVKWQSFPIEDPRDGVNRYGAKGLYRVGLYRMDITIRHDNEVLTTYQTRQVGYQQVRLPGSFDEI